VNADGTYTVTGSERELASRSGTVKATADTPYIYDGFEYALRSAVWDVHVSTRRIHRRQDVLVTFQGNAVSFSGFKTELPAAQNGTYESLYGLGLK
jgi:hypothetical protein